ncbi:hypothetical protein [Nocardia amamiensis]|uniref:hypothetical protein n=1 Tax=Nocardia amamiensis TaxID=404578 RepID=UPI00082BE1A9|nr:hypothetical protein [Nocardia amamiensis]
MPLWLSLTLAVLAGLAAIGLLAGVMLLAVGTPGDPGSRASSAAANSAGQMSRHSNHAGAHSVWPHAWTHRAPDTPFTVKEAHDEMQRHRDCRLDHCPRKDAAFTVLIETGRVRPDSSRQKY